MTAEANTKPVAGPKTLRIQIDGASKGNPGPAGIGIVLTPDVGPSDELSEYIGVASNNVAEYTAFITALEEALIRKASRVAIETDSELLAKQLNREYRVRSDALRFLFRRAKRLMAAFEKVEIKRIPRAENKRADSLAQDAIPHVGNQQGLLSEP